MKIGERIRNLRQLSNLTQEELAAASNMSRSTVFHLLGDLVSQGICELGYREVRILDMKRLADIVEEASTA